MTYRKSGVLLLPILLFFAFKSTLAQVDSSILPKGDSSILQKHNAAILLPLYLDTLFYATGDYKYGNSIPKFALPALEFYNGVQLAADSLRQEGIDVRIQIVDSRKKYAVQQLFYSSNPHKPELLIGVAQNGNELKNLAALALTNKVPFISATYPNDGGVTASPNLMIINSTLKTHCFALYKFLQRNRSTENILIVSRKGNLDDRIKNYLAEAENNTYALKMKLRMVSLPDTFTVNQLAVYLDSTQSNTVLGASLDDDFSMRLIRTLSSLHNTYKASILGMPTWDEYNLTKPEYKNVDVFFSTPFISYSANPKVYTSLTQKFTQIANSKPSDMVFKGFEITYRYVKNLAQHPDAFVQHVNDTDRKVFADFYFEPVTLKKDSPQPDYWENKKIYFVKKTDGIVKGVY